MAIISANRYSKMNGNFIIAANESYGVEDMGRILIENERNDQAIFTAAMMNDMHEIKCRTEGTLLESELQALSESSVKQFFDKIIEKLKKFWAKIKGFFKRAYAMITAYVVRNGKAFVAANRKELNKVTDSQEIKGKVWVPTNGKIPDEHKTLDFDVFNIDSVNGMNADDSAADMTKAMLKKATRGQFDEDGNFYKWLKEANYKEATNPKIGECGGVNNLIAMLENGMEPVKKIKEAEKKVEKDLKASIKKLQDEQKKLENESKDQKVKEDAGKKVTFYKTASTAMSNAMSTSISALVKLQKFKLAQARIALARAIAKNNVVESTLLESQIREIIEDASEMEDCGEPTPEETEAAEKLLAAAQELIDSAEGAEEEVNGDEE